MRFPGTFERREVNLVWEQLLIHLRITGLYLVCPVFKRGAEIFRIAVLPPSSELTVW